MKTVFTAKIASLRHSAVLAKLTVRKLAWPEIAEKLFFLDFVVFPLLISLCLYLTFRDASPLQALQLGGIILVGALAWTFFEYVIHRFAFHHFPVLKPIHMGHHDDPRGLTGTPTLVTVAAIYVLAYAPVAFFAGVPIAAAWTAGIMAGYLVYVSVHYVVHHLGSGGSATLRRLIRLHALHHHDDKYNFGVTSDFWDRVFGTRSAR